MQLKDNVGFTVSPDLHEIKLSYRQKTKAADRPKITQSSDSYSYLSAVWEKDNLDLYESFYCVYLNRANRVLGWLKISQGGVSGTVADLKLILGTALKVAASGIILSHNHPSGNLRPSQADIRLTRQAKEGAKLLDLAVLDHIIVTSDGYYSFADEGQL